MNEESLWQDLARYAEEQSGEAPTLPRQDELPATVPLGDRLAELYLRGTIPIFLMTLAATLLLGLAHDLRVMSVGLLASPALVWLLTPFVRSVDGVSALRLVTMSAPVLILNLFLGLGSATLFHSWQGNPVHVEFLAWAFQGILETALRPTLLVYLGLSIALAVILGWAKSRYPWTDDSLWYRRPRVLGWIAVGLTAVVMVGAFSMLRSSSQEDQWKAEVWQSIQQRPYAGLPADGPERLWQDRNEEIDRRVAKASGSHDFSAREHREEALAKLPLFMDLKAEPPSSRRELRAAINYLGGVTDGDLPAEDVHVRYIRAQLEAIPFNRSIGVAGLVEYLLLPAISRSQKTPEELDLLAREIALTKAAVQTPMETLDQVAYWLLWVEPETLTDRGDTEPGWSIGDSQVSPSTFHRALVYRGVPRPRALEAFGFTLPWSPTRLVFLAERHSLTREWIAVRTQLAGLGADARSEVFEARSTPEAVGFGPRFWSSLSYSAPADRCAQLLETAELMSRILEVRKRTSQWPDDLAPLLSKIQFTEAAERRYRWEPEQLKLYDAVLGLEQVLPSARPSPAVVAPR